MSGHSHAKTVRKTKEANAQKRAQFFAKAARLISVAVREGGPNPETNAKLRMAIEVAKSYNVPKENIENAIKRASGGGEAMNLEEVFYEAYGPGGVALIIEGITENKNRAFNEVKQVLSRFNGKLVEEGAIRWMFERKGLITINLTEQKENLKNKEALELLAIEAGAEDLEWQGENLFVYTAVSQLYETKKILEEKGIKVESISLDWKPKELVKVNEKEKETLEKLFEALDELDSVQEIYSNLAS
jgi:YebC/PmpR family DNA-binding regulatory protein